jgi:hypothetical protein
VRRSSEHHPGTPPPRKKQKNRNPLKILPKRDVKAPLVKKRPFSEIMQTGRDFPPPSKGRRNRGTHFPSKFLKGYLFRAMGTPPSFVESAVFCGARNPLRTRPEDPA